LKPLTSVQDVCALAGMAAATVIPVSDGPDSLIGYCRYG
jgi:hypothetical protein